MKHNQKLMSREASLLSYSGLQIIYLITINIFYAFTGFFTKKASLNEFLSWKYVAYLVGAVMVLGIYAILWQQIIKKMPIADAYMFRGTAIIFTMLIAAICFGETIGVKNIIGSVIIICGIALFAKA